MASDLADPTSCRQLHEPRLTHSLGHRWTAETTNTTLTSLPQQHDGSYRHIPHRTASQTGKTTGASLYALVPLSVSPLHISHITYHTWQTDLRQQMAHPANYRLAPYLPQPSLCSVIQSVSQSGPARPGTRHTTSPATLDILFLCLAPFFFFRLFVPSLDQTASKKSWHGMA